MKHVRILLVFAFFFGATFARAEIDAEKRKEITTMLKLTGMEGLVDQMMGQMLAGLRQQSPQVPAEFWDSFSKKVRGADLIEKLLPLYDKYYSLEDLKAVNAFYSSPAGQRVLSTLPSIMQESMVIGQEWGQQVGQQAMQEILEQQKQKPASDS